jgi:hypothetical protein
MPETGRVQDGMSQAHYMRLVRLRNQEVLQGRYGYDGRWLMSGRTDGVGSGKGWRMRESEGGSSV